MSRRGPRGLDPHSRRCPALAGRGCGEGTIAGLLDSPRSPAPAPAGGSLGLVLANVPAVFFGQALVRRVSMRLVRGAAAAAFALLGFLTLLGLPRLG